ncbi:hypothetical protein LXA43DRAFT_1119572 [Ganoderma leucocontextum]|nr:hypothetical protein LXA43DRAFT_1119572 [Ganoderma leucocontextum]
MLFMSSSPVLYHVTEPFYIMHRALSNVDILSHIFMMLVYECEDAEVDFAQLLELEAAARVQLLRCATLCKDFCHPALDALWWRLDNLVPLMRLLSCFIPTKIKRKVRPDPNNRFDNGILYIRKGELSRKEWLRFQSYAKRVRILNYPKQASVTPHIIAQLSKWNDGEPLLPGLKELTWVPVSPTDTAALLLGTKSLELLHIVLDSIELPDHIAWLSHSEKVAVLSDPSNRSASDKHIEELLKTYAGRTPRLNTLELSTPVHPSCLAPLTLFTKLQHISLRDTPINVDFLRSLSTLKGLESLLLNFGPVPNARGSDQLIHGFPHLAHVELCARAADMTLFFTLLNPLEALTSLELVYPNGAPETSSTYRRPLEAIRARGHAPRLARVKLDITTRWRTHDTLGELVQPLLDPYFRTLANVAVSAPRSGYRVTAGDLEGMARAWPHLARLYLNWSARDSEGPGAPPVTALAHFARHCPDLRTLILARIDTDAQVPTDLKVVGTHRLQHLFTLGSCPVKDARGVGRYVFLLFPRLLMPYMDPRPSGWDEVLVWVSKYRDGWREKLLRLGVEKEEKREKAADSPPKVATQASTTGSKSLGDLD